MVAMDTDTESLVAPEEASRPDLAFALLAAVELAERNGHGLAVQPFSKGSRNGGIGSDQTWGFDGYEVSAFTANGGSPLGAGRTLAEALGQAIETMSD